MQKIKIHKLGPIDDCEISIKEFMILTGPQASGKSTLAKSIFFFKNMKNILLELVRKNMLLGGLDQVVMSYRNRFIREIRSNFLQTFGSTWCMNNDMYLEYQFTPARWIRVSLREHAMRSNYIWIDLSEELVSFLDQIYEKEIDLTDLCQDQISEIKTKIETFFDDTSEIIYIPAGRSLITLLSSQLSYIYSSMDDAQRRTLDYCTQRYLERILQLKTHFSASYDQMIQNQILLTDKKIDRDYLQSVVALMRDILKGEYRNIEGEERLQVSGSQYVKLNFASSGQQEVVWILNVLFYQIINNRKAYFIIEEPESHLFPAAQKKIMQFVSTVKNSGNEMLVTTHSPYILGELNNLLYAKNISGKVPGDKLAQIVDERQWISYSNFDAHFLSGGEVKCCLDDEFHSIKNEVIDGAADEIDQEFDDMVELGITKA